MIFMRNVTEVETRKGAVVPGLWEREREEVL